MNESSHAPKVYQLDEDANAGIEAAAEAVGAGQCVVVPTDTVYGIGADAFSGDAVTALLAAKQRDESMPPPVLVAEPSMLRALAAEVPEAAAALAKAHWPGALTLIVKAQRTLKLELGETGGTVAVRVPDHDRLRQLLRRTGPLAVSSANISGQPAAETCEAAKEMLKDTVAVYLDGGPTAGLQPSTIVDFTRSAAGRVVRQGALSLPELRASAPKLVLAPIATKDEEPAALPEAPTANEESPE